MVKNMAIRTERRIPVNRGCYGVLHHFKKYSVISWRQLYLWRKPEYPKKHRGIVCTSTDFLRHDDVGCLIRLKDVV
jgi:hypothetical protein